jgi:hypothetical protein
MPLVDTRGSETLILSRDREGAIADHVPWSKHER